MRLIIRSIASEEIAEAAEYIAEDNVDAANRFLDAVERTIERLTSAPKLGRVMNFGLETEIRMWFVESFHNCLIFYVARSDEVDILRMIHSSRDYRRIMTDEED